MSPGSSPSPAAIASVRSVSELLGASQSTAQSRTGRNFGTTSNNTGPRNQAAATIINRLERFIRLGVGVVEKWYAMIAAFQTTTAYHFSTTPTPNDSSHSR